MKANKSIMDSHETYLEALNKDVATYSMAELLECQKIARSSTNYLAYNLVYTNEIEKRKKRIGG